MHRGKQSHAGQMDRRDKSHLIVKDERIGSGWGKIHVNRGSQECEYFDKQAKEAREKITKFFQLLD